MGLGVRTGKTDDATIVMKPQPHPPTPEVLAGLVERVTYHNEENGFCVLRIRARGHREPENAAFAILRNGARARHSGRSYGTSTKTRAIMRAL
jgi:hypothetical protein